MFQSIGHGDKRLKHHISTLKMADNYLSKVFLVSGDVSGFRANMQCLARIGHRDKRWTHHISPLNMAENYFSKVFL